MKKKEFANHSDSYRRQCDGEKCCGIRFGAEGSSEEAMTDAGITMGTLRFSIGLEHPEDIIEELDEALLRI